MVPLQFLIDRFGSPDSFRLFLGDFSVSEERWNALRVDVLLACVISILYLPAGSAHLDMRIVAAVRALQEDHTILPMILADTYMSASYCQSFRGRVFRGSSTLLYMWFMSHLSPIGHFRRQGFCFSHDITTQFSFRPASCIDVASWTSFLSSIEDPFHLLVYSGYCSFMSFLTHAPDLDFIPIAGLRGVTTYHPLAVMGQFDQRQDLHPFAGAAAYRFLISSRTERDLLQVYETWDRRILAEYSESCHIQTFAYGQWLRGDLESASLSRTWALDDSGVIFPEDTTDHPISADSAPSRVTEDSQLRLALIAAEAERDAALVERDDAIRARDAAIADREAIVFQTRAVVDAHFGTVSRATALLDRIDLMGQQIAGDVDASDLSTTLSILLQLVSDL